MPPNTPRYAVPQPDGSTITVDLTEPGEYQDLALGLQIRDLPPMTIRVHHTGEVDVFCDIVERALDATGAGAFVAQVREEVGRLAVGLNSVDIGEHTLRADQRVRITHPRPLGERYAATYPGSGSGQQLRVAPNPDGTLLSFIDLEHGRVLEIHWPTDTLHQLAAGLIWRTYAAAGQSYSWLSRTPTTVYERILALAAHES